MITAQEAKELSTKSFPMIDYYNFDNVIRAIEIDIQTAARKSKREITFSVFKNCVKSVISHLKDYGYEVVDNDNGIGNHKLTITWHN